MSYQAIGKEAWDALPAMFYNNELAETLDKDTYWWTYSYMFPHKFLAEVSVPQSDGSVFETVIDIRDNNLVTRDDVTVTMRMCGMECFIKYTAHDGTFKKVLMPIKN